MMIRQYVFILMITNYKILKFIKEMVRRWGDKENQIFLAKNVAEWIEHNKVGEMISIIVEAEKLKEIISHLGQNGEMRFS